MLEDREEELILRAFGSWDTNGDGELQLEEFTQMVQFANPDATQRKITRAYMSASGGEDQVDKAKLPQALIANGLQLADRPANYDPDATPSDGTTNTPPGSDTQAPHTTIRTSSSLASMIKITSAFKGLRSGNGGHESGATEEDLTKSSA